MSHVGHLRTTPEFVRNVPAARAESFVVMNKFRKNVRNVTVPAARA